MAGLSNLTASIGIRLLSETTTSSESSEEAHEEGHHDVSLLEQGSTRQSVSCLLCPVPPCRNCFEIAATMWTSCLAS